MGTLGPSRNGLSKAAQTAPEESRLETAMDVVEGATPGRLCAFDGVEYFSTPLDVKTTIESLIRATSAVPIDANPSGLFSLIGGDEASWPRGIRNAPRE
jgi:hypothetical protein